jgi:hypothetical protein
LQRSFSTLLTHTSHICIHYYYDNQTKEHILLECAILHEDRERLIAAVVEQDNWPINKDKLIKRYYKAFVKFTQQLDKIKEMNT